MGKIERPRAGPSTIRRHPAVANLHGAFGRDAAACAALALDPDFRADNLRNAFQVDRARIPAGFEAAIRLADLPEEAAAGSP